LHHFLQIDLHPVGALIAGGRPCGSIEGLESLAGSILKLAFVSLTRGMFLCKASRELARPLAENEQVGQ
jgi:hypothetical protein